VLPPRSLALLIAPAAVVALAVPASAATLSPQPATAQTQGIIMRDGGICDPIRHMGC
jgi:Spy/CpxP family protein refolding chaperone